MNNDDADKKATQEELATMMKAKLAEVFRKPGKSRPEVDLTLELHNRKNIN